MGLYMSIDSQIPYHNLHKQIFGVITPQQSAIPSLSFRITRYDIPALLHLNCWYRSNVIAGNPAKPITAK